MSEDIDAVRKRILQIMAKIMAKYPISPSGSSAQDLQKLSIAYGILTDKQLLLEKYDGDA